MLCYQKMDYADLVTRIVLWRSASDDLIYDFKYGILKEMEEGDAKNKIRDLYHKADELGNEIDNLLYNRRPSPGDLEELYILTDKHWEVILELYKVFGQDGFKQQMTCFWRLMHSSYCRKKAKEVLDRFLNGLSG